MLLSKQLDATKTSIELENVSEWSNIKARWTLAASLFLLYFVCVPPKPQVCCKLERTGFVEFHFSIVFAITSLLPHLFASQSPYGSVVNILREPSQLTCLILETNSKGPCLARQSYCPLHLSADCQQNIYGIKVLLDNSCYVHTCQDTQVLLIVGLYCLGDGSLDRAPKASALACGDIPGAVRCCSSFCGDNGRSFEIPAALCPSSVGA